MPQCTPPACLSTTAMHLVLQVALFVFSFVTSGDVCLGIICASASLYVLFVLMSLLVDWRSLACIAWDRAFLKRHASPSACTSALLFVFAYLLPAILVLVAAFVQLPPLNDTKSYGRLQLAVFGLAVTVLAAALCHCTYKVFHWCFPTAEAYIQLQPDIASRMNTFAVQMDEMMMQMDAVGSRIGAMDVRIGGIEAQIGAIKQR